MTAFLWGLTSGLALLLGLLPVFAYAPSYLPLAVQELLHGPEVHIIFGGDMMFDRTIRAAMQKNGGGYLFSCLDPIFSKADLVVANLEGPITDHDSISLDSIPGDGNNYTFTFPTTTAALLAAHHVGLVSIGNNHIMNFGRDGLMQTEVYLQAAGVDYFGLPAQAGDPSDTHVAEREVRGIKLAFINYNQFAPGGWVDAASTTLVQIRAEKEAGRVVVVYTHWGEEYVPPVDRVKRLAHSFVDAGADIVIGSHPHIVQESELYGSTSLTTGKGAYIYYSLGNLIFDQYWNDAVSHGLLLDVTFNAQGVEKVSEIPVQLQRDRKTCPVE